MTDKPLEVRSEPETSPPQVRQIRLGGWWAISLRVLRRLAPSQISLIAAGVAFYALLAVFPAIAAVMALAGLFTSPDKVVRQLETVSELLPEEAAAILVTQATGVVASSDEGLSLTLWLGVGFAIYLSTRATTGMLHGLNQAFESREDRSVVRYWSTVILLTVALLLGGILLLLLMVGLPTILAFVALDFGTEQAIRNLRWIAVALVFMKGLTSLYHWGPSRRPLRWRWFSVGAVLAGLCWFVGSVGFEAYVVNFGNYNETFGSLGGVIILLTWLWLTAYIALLGALVDAEIENELAQQIPFDAV